jgi:two-component system phosphate regulon response regulator PhoB
MKRAKATLPTSPVPFEPARSGIRRRRPKRPVEALRNVLVVEDDYDQRHLVVETLWSGGYAALGVSTLGEARAELECKLPLLVVLDRRLPDGDGIAFVREIRKQPRTARTPVLAVTAAAGRHDVDDAFVAGCEGFLSKPCTSEALLAAVQRLIQERASQE